MPPTVQRPPGVDVSVFNPRNTNYIKGNANTDGSIRFVPTTKPKDCKIEIRKDGIFVSAGLGLGASSLALGLDLSTAAQGSQLEIKSVESDSSNLSIGSEFNDLGSAPGKVAVLRERINRVVVQSVTSGELITKSDTNTFTATVAGGNAFRYVFYFKTGSVAATASVTLQISKGLTPGGDIFFSKEMPVSDWIANTEVVVELEGGLNITPGNDFSTTLFSDEDFSLLGDFVTPGVGRFFAFDIQPYEYQVLISASKGTNRFLFNNNAEQIIDNNGNILLTGTQVVEGVIDLNPPQPESPFPFNPFIQV